MALELMEQLRQRTRVVVIGPSGSGKSTLWKMLRAALTKLRQSVKQYVMNPKAMHAKDTGICVCLCLWSLVYMHAHVHLLHILFITAATGLLLLMAL